jgi:hypothetical protein
MAHAYNPNYLGGRCREILVQGQTGQKHKTIWKANKAKGLGMSAVDRVLVHVRPWVQSPIPPKKLNVLWWLILIKPFQNQSLKTQGEKHLLIFHTLWKILLIVEVSSKLYQKFFILPEYTISFSLSHHNHVIHLEPHLTVGIFCSKYPNGFC